MKEEVGGPGTLTSEPAGPTGEPDWANAPAFGRRETLLLALQQVYGLRPRGATIVETGTSRNEGWSGCSGDGWSTVAFGWYASLAGGRVWTVDVDAGAIQACKRLTADCATWIEYVVSDSVAFLKVWGADRPPIDLLYLDSLDYLDRAASEAHSLAEAQAALPWLAPTCLVLFDDTNACAEGYSGKGALAVPFLLSQGFTLEFAEGGQVLVSRRT